MHGRLSSHRKTLTFCLFCFLQTHRAKEQRAFWEGGWPRGGAASSRLPRLEGFIDTHGHLEALFARLSFQGTFAPFRRTYSQPLLPEGVSGLRLRLLRSSHTDRRPLGGPAERGPEWGASGCHPHFAPCCGERQEGNLQAFRHPGAVAFGAMGLDDSLKCSTPAPVQHKAATSSGGFLTV